MTNLLTLAGQSLHAQGGRMTAQRRLILETLSSLASHPTAEDLFAQVHALDPSLNRSTVYRTLRWLEEAGLVSARWFEDDRRQERFDPLPGQDHHHFRCRACGGIFEFPAPQVEAIQAEFSAHSGAQVESATLILYGLCHDCAGQAGAGQGGQL